MAHPALTWCLSIWVGLACPSLCAFGGGSSSKQSGSNCTCCAKHDSKPEVPTLPADSSKDTCSCFCSGHGVQLSKTDLLPEIEASTIACFCAEPEKLIVHLEQLLGLDTFRITHPPDNASSLPLLI